MADYQATKLPCPDCSSSDAFVINDNGSTKCYSCGKFTRSSEASIIMPECVDDVIEKPSFAETELLLRTGNYGAIPERGITQATAEKYGVLHTDAKTYFITRQMSATFH